MKHSELRTLQAQINPHLLYNSLDYINCVAINHRLPDISDMVQKLVSFYKLGLNKGQDYVSLQDELEHVKAYAAIQNLRYPDSIRLIIDVPEKLLDCPISKITLQPIVENAIVHGILESDEEQGTILISVVNQDEALQWKFFCR
ncbi:hypothetical protein D7Z26_14175 [Cohnella endophytica]|uniref:Signal transduction histidine kinase internal region domain-containing protein n=1 Tax=Cohnella endophytica TaxID=2419778 RepID=A0A494XQJ6_9BACL|nr:histidine kinase [Cohnella endophytica]RKP52898.1 hypothetical protein D7Z26_14175 [Cohnella endophytica]